MSSYCQINRRSPRTNRILVGARNVWDNFTSCEWKGWGLGILAVAMLFGYLFEVNDLSIKGFEIKALEQKIAGLEKEHNDLKFTVAKLQSMGDLQGAVRVQQMVKISQAEYLNTSPDVVALNK